jgi:UDP-N-acetylmuramyl pentapeptide synthase
MASNIDYKKNNSEFNSVLNGTSHRFKVNVPGEAFIYNSLSAISVGSLFNMDYKDIYDGISNFNLTKERMDIESINGVTIINDCYNANLDSMKNAINYLGTYKERKVAIIGDMLELGEYSKDLHKEVGKCLKDNNIDIVITVGDNSKVISEVYNKEIYNYDNNKEVMNKIKSIIKKNDVILIKASNSMNFIEIYSYIKEILK